MQNGETGSYNYWDETYSGSGNTTANGSFLSGGTGDLTDGIIAASSWNVTEPPAGNGPYVGWRHITPTITFHFSPKNVALDSITLYLDDRNGSGGVGAPSAVIIDGVIYDLSDPAGTGPFSVTLSNLGFYGSSVDVTLVDGVGSWVFLSEVTFDGEYVPEPGVLGLTLFGLIAAGLGRRRKRS